MRPGPSGYLAPSQRSSLIPGLSNHLAFLRRLPFPSLRLHRQLCLSQTTRRALSKVDVEGRTSEGKHEGVGYPGKLLHDCRRSAVRTLERSGVPRSTAMAMVGHKTESIYRRYAIQDEAMLREAAAKLDTWAVEQRAKADAERKGQLKRFKKRQTA
jgi:hypothetical protein